MADTKNVDTFFPYQEIEEVEPVYFRKLKKTILVDNQWENRVFYEITRYNMSRHDIIHLLTTNYGQPKYADTWWSTHNANKIIMNEKIYTHYKLME